MLEVVSEARGGRAAVDRGGRRLGVDWVLGGTHAEEALPILPGSGLPLLPVPGHRHRAIRACCAARWRASPRTLRELTALDGVHGLDLLAYRFDGDVARPCARRGRGLGRAGHRGRKRRLARAHPALAALGVWGYTIGGAIFEGRLPGGPGVAGQVREVLALTARADTEAVAAR